MNPLRKLEQSYPCIGVLLFPDIIDLRFAGPARDLLPADPGV